MSLRYILHAAMAINTPKGIYSRSHSELSLTTIVEWVCARVGYEAAAPESLNSIPSPIYNIGPIGAS